MFALAVSGIFEVGVKEERKRAIQAVFFNVQAMKEGFHEVGR